MLVVKILPADAGDIRDSVSIAGLRRSFGEGNGNLLQPQTEEPGQLLPTGSHRVRHD